MTKKLFAGLAVAVMIGVAGLANATQFTNTIDFDAQTTGGPNPVTYQEVVNSISYTHTLTGLTTPPYTLTDATLTIRQSGNSNTPGEAWFTYGENGSSDILIGRLSASKGSSWTIDQWTLSSSILDLIDNGSPWKITINLFDNTSGTDKIKIDYSTLAGNYSTTPTPVPIPASILLFGTGLAGLMGVSRRKKK